MISKAQSKKENKLVYIQLQNFCAANNTSTKYEDNAQNRRKQTTFKDSKIKNFYNFFLVKYKIKLKF